MSDDPFLARKVGVLSMAYAARVFLGLAEIYGDGRTGLIVLAIAAANTAHLDLRTGDKSMAGPDAVLRDDVRRPVSVSQLAKSIGMPFETARQHVNRLIDAGICVRVEGGVIMPAVALRRPELERALTTNFVHVRQLVCDLLAIGLDPGPSSQSGDPV